MCTNTINYLIIITVILLLVLIFYVLGLKNNIQSLLTFSKRPQPSDRLQLLKLQASERFMLLAERIDPMNLLNRIAPLDKKAQEYRMELVTTIQSEYNHNVAWQLYIDDPLALNLKHIVNEAMLTINMAMDNLSSEAKAIDLSKNIITQQSGLKNNIYFQFQSYLRKYIN